MTYFSAGHDEVNQAIARSFEIHYPLLNINVSFMDAANGMILWRIDELSSGATRVTFHHRGYDQASSRQYRGVIKTVLSDLRSRVRETSSNLPPIAAVPVRDALVVTFYAETVPHLEEAVYRCDTDYVVRHHETSTGYNVVVTVMDDNSTRLILEVWETWVDRETAEHRRIVGVILGCLDNRYTLLERR